MSLLDLQEENFIYEELDTMWKEYDELEADVCKNLSDIEEMIENAHLEADAYLNNSLVLLKSKIAVGATFVWWILAVNYMWIVTAHQHSQPLLCITWY